MKETSGYVFNHTMLRVKDQKKSIEFYENVLGMTKIRELDFPEWEFSLFFMAYVPEGFVVPQDKTENAKYTFGRESVLELTYNYGTEKNEGPVYHDGNQDPRGFGHICITVPDIKTACERFEKLGVEFQKRLGEGGMKDIAFIKDPDGYWIEIVQKDLM